MNVFFFFSGICLNSLVILRFWRSVPLIRKKLCYFMIMLLSCFDLLAVLTNNPLTALTAMLRLTGKLDVNARWPHISVRSTCAFLVFSYFALLVMNVDRYLATSYPIFHGTSVTKEDFLVVRKSRKNKGISLDMKKTFPLKNISSCLPAVACLVVVYIPWSGHIGLKINLPETKNIWIMIASQGCGL